MIKIIHSAHKAESVTPTQAGIWLTTQVTTKLPKVSNKIRRFIGGKAREILRRCPVRHNRHEEIIASLVLVVVWRITIEVCCVPLR